MRAFDHISAGVGDIIILRSRLGVIPQRLKIIECRGRNDYPFDFFIIDSEASLSVFHSADRAAISVNRAHLHITNGAAGDDFLGAVVR